MVYLLKMVIFHSYVNVYQRVRSLKWWEPLGTNFGRRSSPTTASSEDDSNPILYTPWTPKWWVDPSMLRQVTEGGWPFRNHTWPKKIPYLQIACSQQIDHWTINIAKGKWPQKIDHTLQTCDFLYLKRPIGCTPEKGVQRYNGTTNFVQPILSWPESRWTAGRLEGWIGADSDA